MEEIGSVLRDVDVCIACPGLAPCRKLPIGAHGNTASRVLLVQDAPDEKSMQAGRYWSDIPGQKLRHICLELKAEPEDLFYLTDSVKCISRKGRPHTEKEITECSGFLRREIDAISPAMIITIGEKPTKRVFLLLGLAYKNILSLHNENGYTAVKAGELDVIPLLHPSKARTFMDYVLYTMHLKQAFKAAMGHIGR